MKETKTYCDICKDEIFDDDYPVVIYAKTSIMLFNYNEICDYCFKSIKAHIEILKKKTRTKQIPNN